MKRELLSAYMDGEQVSRQLTDELCQDIEMKQSWQRYHVIRTVIRQESTVILGPDFTSQLADLIDSEETYGVIEEQPSVAEALANPFMRKIKAMFMPLTQVAVAAGVCLAVVLGVQMSTSKEINSSPDMPVLQTSPFYTSVQAVSYNAPTQDIVTEDKLEEHNKRIGLMLQNYELKRRIYADDVQLNPEK